MKASEKFNFAKAVNVILDSDLRMREVAVAIALAKFCGEDHHAWTTLSVLERLAGAARHTIIKALETLTSQPEGSPVRLIWYPGSGRAVSCYDLLIDGSSGAARAPQGARNGAVRAPLRTCEKCGRAVLWCSSSAVVVQNVARSGAARAPDPQRDPQKEPQREGADAPKKPRAPVSRQGTKRRKPKTPKLVTLPEDWAPTSEHEAFAREHDLELDKSAERFRDWHVAKGSTFANWDRAYLAWLKRDAEKAHSEDEEHGKGTPQPPRTPKPDGYVYGQPRFRRVKIDAQGKARAVEEAKRKHRAARADLEAMFGDTGLSQAEAMAKAVEGALGKAGGS